MIECKKYKSFYENKKPYKSIFSERKMQAYKAWYNPSTDYFRQFSTNGIHNEIAENELYMSEKEALKKGYYRIFVGHEVDIDSDKMPTDREFMATRYAIEKNSYKNFKGTIWQIMHPDKDYYFPAQSFLFADSIKDGNE